MNLSMISTCRIIRRQDIGIPAIVVRMEASAFVRDSSVKQALRYTHIDSSL